MYTKRIIIDRLKSKKFFIDESTLEKFIKNWKIDAIYEDDNKEEYFDEFAVEKIIKGMGLKTKGESDRRIAYEINKEPRKTELPQPVKTNVYREMPSEGAELKKISLDITNQTVSFLADSIAQKITSDITDHLKETDYLQSAMEHGSLQRDNEIMAKQISKLIKQNEELRDQVAELELKNEKFKPFVGNLYIKHD